MTSSATRDELIYRFCTLFDGNRGAYGTEEGKCERLSTTTTYDRPDLWDKMAGHLLGTREPIGVYLMRMESIMMRDGYYDRTWVVHWGCVDFDEGEEESWVHAKNVWLALTTFGITGWIERSRSKGYHVWVFASEPIEAPIMRRALLAACQLVDAPTKEINPKQDYLVDGQLGNYVRLPYPGWLGAATRSSRRSMMNPDHSGYYSLQHFVSAAWEARTGVEPLRTLAGHYVAPEAPIRRRDWESRPAEALEDAIARLRGKARVIFEQGPLEGSGRGHTLFKLARYLREDDRHTVEEAVEIIRDADNRWGKFYARPDGEKRIMELVERAWFTP